MFSALLDPTDCVLQISPQQRSTTWQQSLDFSTVWGRWNAYLNQLCLDTCLTWLKAEHLPSIKAHLEPALWGTLNGSILTVDNIRIALIPSESIDRSELEVAQEWVDVPSLAADYYLGVQIAPDCQEIVIYGYTTHQQLKNKGSYDAQERTYCLDIDDLNPDLNALWLSYPHYTSSQTQAALTAIPTLDPARAEALIARLTNPDLIMVRLEVPFQTWAALLDNPQWRKRLSQQRQTANSTSVFTKLSNWVNASIVEGLQGQIDEIWQSVDRVLLPQQVAIAVRSTASQDRVEIAADDFYRAKVFDLQGGQIALLIGISPISNHESRISLKIYPAGGAAYLPGATQLRLLSGDGSEIGKVNAVVTEIIQLQFRVSEGEQFEIEIDSCGQIFKERFEL
jgi:Protein of unknown function (DUF1822)